MAQNEHLELYGASEFEDESKLPPIRLVKETRSELKGYRKPQERDWKIFENAYYGKHHITGDGKKTVKNHIFKVIEGEVPILTDSMHGTQILAQQEDRVNDAKNLELAIRYVHQENNLQLLLPTLVRDSLIAAPGFLYVYWDPDWADGEGGIRYRHLNWRHVLLDGGVSTVEDSSKGQISFPLRRSELMRLWPEHRQKIQRMPGNEDTLDDDDDFEGREDRDTSDASVNEQGRPKDHKAKDLLNYTETWLKSYDLAPIPEEDTAAQLLEERAQLLAGSPPDIGKWEDHPAHVADHQLIADQVLAELGLPPGTTIEQATQHVQTILLDPNAPLDEKAMVALQAKLTSLKVTLDHIKKHNAYAEENPQGQMPKYKDGWRVIKSVNDLILEDEGNPEENGMIPLVPFYGYKDGTIYGFGEIKNIHSPQMSLNHMDDKEYRSLKINANAGWKYELETGLKPKQLTDEEGLAIGYPKGTNVERLQPGEVSPQFQVRKEGDKLDIEDISGIREASQGQMPRGGASGVAIERLQTQAIGRIRLKDRYLAHYSIKRLSKIVASMIINHWSDERRLRLVTDDNKTEDLIWDPLRFKDIEYSVEIAPGSMAGIDKSQLNAFYKTLLDAKEITILEFLSVVDLPKKEILMDLVKKRLDSEQQLQDLQIQNIKLKALVSTELLTPEEQKVLIQIRKEELVEQALAGNMGALQGQPEQGELDVAG